MITQYNSETSLMLKTPKHIDIMGEWHFYYQRGFSRKHFSLQAQVYDGKSWLNPSVEDIKRKIIELGYNFCNTKTWQSAFNWANCSL